MNWTVLVRYVNCALFAVAGFLMVAMPTVRNLMQHFPEDVVHPDMVAVLALAIPGAIVLASTIWAFRKADNEIPLLLWLALLGALAPSLPPTLRQAFMACPPPAVSCGVAGSMPWGSILIGLIGTTAAAAAVCAAHKREPQIIVEQAALKKKLRLFGAALALIVSALFVWTFYDHYTHTLMDAVKAAFERGKIVGQGQVPIGGSDFFEPSETITLFIGAMVALMAATAALQGSYRWLLYTWPFLLGLISYEFAAAADAIGAFGWPYRDFTERYVWFALFFLCCGGSVLAWHGTRRTTTPQYPSRN
jgi:hypothetical protein